MEIENKEKTRYSPVKLGVRHRQAIMLFLCMTFAYVVRTSISVTVIAMTDASNNVSSIETFKWDKKIQNYVFGSFYWGYVFMQIPAGQLSYRYGGKWFLGFALIVNGLLSFVIPFAASNGGWVAVCSCRFMQGFSQGLVFPSTHTLLGRWAPLSERNRIANFVFTGATLGTILAMPISGYLSSTQYGWPLIFYTVGSVCILFGSFWLIFGASSPATHRTITFTERNFIEASLEQSGEEKVNQIKDVPWRLILKSPPFLSLVIAHVGAVWGFFTVLNEMPTFLGMILKVNVAQSGFLSAIPYLISWFCLLISSTIADYLINHNKISITNLRKITNTIGTWGPAFAMILLTYIPANYFYLTIMMMVLIVSLDIINCLGFLMNYIDLSPKFAGMLVSVGNCMAVVLSNLGPIITGIILQDTADIKQWRIVFMVPAVIYFFSNLIFIIFGKGDKQKWEKLEENPMKSVDENLIEKT